MSVNPEMTSAFAGKWLLVNLLLSVSWLLICFVFGSKLLKRVNSIFSTAFEDLNRLSDKFNIGFSRLKAKGIDKFHKVHFQSVLNTNKQKITILI